MGNIKEEIKVLASEAQLYAEEKLESVKLDAMDKTVTFTGLLLTWLIITIVGLIALVILTGALSIMLSEWLESYTLGFGIVGSAYLLLVIVLIVFRGKLLTRFIEEQMYGSILDSSLNELEENDK